MEMRGRWIKVCWRGWGHLRAGLGLQRRSRLALFLGGYEAYECYHVAVIVSHASSSLVSHAARHASAFS